MPRDSSQFLPLQEFREFRQERNGYRSSVSARTSSETYPCPPRRLALRLNVSPAIDNSNFRGITPGIETLPCRFSLPRHRHLGAYATVVLAGSFEESGYVGRVPGVHTPPLDICRSIGHWTAMPIGWFPQALS
jgi:hypothetical protein